MPGWLLLTLAWGAGTLLAGHGVIFIALGALTPATSIEWTSEVRWYSLFWGPWFLLGGSLFMAAARAFHRRTGGGRLAMVSSALGGLGGIGAASAPLVISAIAR